MILKLLFLCLVNHTNALFNTGFGVNWKDFDNVLVPKPFIFEISNIYSLTQCVLLCLQNEACVSFFYRRQHRRCQFYDVLFMSPEDGEQDTGTEYYSLTTGDCVPGYIHYRLLNFCYQLHLDTIAYDDGLADCTSRGEHLVVIDKEDKQNHLVKQIKSSSGAIAFSFFIDGSDVATEGQWVLHDGRPMSYFAWRPGNPTNSSGAKDYIVASKLDNTFLWRDGRLTENKSYICQKDL